MAVRNALLTGGARLLYDQMNGSLQKAQAQTAGGHAERPNSNPAQHHAVSGLVSTEPTRCIKPHAPCRGGQAIIRCAFVVGLRAMFVQYASFGNSLPVAPSTNILRSARHGGLGPGSRLPIPSRLASLGMNIRPSHHVNVAELVRNERQYQRAQGKEKYTIEQPGPTRPCASGMLHWCPAACVSCRRKTKATIRLVSTRGRLRGVTLSAKQQTSAEHQKKKPPTETIRTCNSGYMVRGALRGNAPSKTTLPIDACPAASSPAIAPNP